MERKVFVSRLKTPNSGATSTNVASTTNRVAISRRSKSMTDLNAKLPTRTKSAVTLKPLLPSTSRFPIKPRENAKLAPKRPGPAIDLDDPVKPKVIRTNKPAPYDYKARFNILNEKHGSLLQNFKETKQKLAELEASVGNYQQLKTEIEQLKKTYSLVVEERDRFQTDYTSTMVNWKNSETENEQLRTDNKLLSDNYATLHEDYKSLTAKNIALESELKNLYSKMKEQETLLSEYKKEAQAHDELRRNLHNQIQDLKGTIRVFCRIRPGLVSENSRVLCNINCLDENTLEIKRFKESINNITGKILDTKLEFTFDKVFPGGVCQSDIFDELAQLVQSALDGYHVCVFAYGQTGSGKTYTMQGECTETALGMIPRSVILIFDLLKHLQRQGWIYDIECNFLEIYNETIRDLLNPHSKLPHDIHYNEGRGITVTNITNKTVLCTEDLLQLIEIANRNRAIAVTNFNEHSSRSHAVTRINLCGYNKETSTSCKGSLNLVDLAGSESAKTSCSERLAETKSINKSLSMLGTVISALHNKESHIPYRNSKLTYLLQSSLCGSAKALMFVNIAPFEECYCESVSSLRFAAKVKEIKMNAKRNKLFLKKD